MRRMQPFTIGQNFFNNLCPIAIIVTRQTTTTWLEQLLRKTKRKKKCGEKKKPIRGANISNPDKT